MECNLKRLSKEMCNFSKLFLRSLGVLLLSSCMAILPSLDDVASLGVFDVEGVEQKDDALNSTTLKIEYDEEFSEDIVAYCFLENSSDESECEWEKGVPPVSYNVNSEGQVVLSLWVKNSKDRVSEERRSKRFFVDLTAPLWPAPSITHSLTYNLLVSTPAASLSRNATDNLTSVSYEFAVGTGNVGASLTDLKTWTSFSGSNSISTSGLNLSNGETYYLSFRAVDAAGNASEVHTSSWIVNTSTLAPTFVSFTPTSPSDDDSPVIVGAVNALATTVNLYSDSDCTILLATGSRTDFIGTGLGVTVAQNATTSIYGQGVIGADVEVSNCVLLANYTHDSIDPAAPSIVLNDPVSSPGNDSTPQFTIALTGGVNFVSSDLITLHEGADCSGGVVGSIASQTGTSAALVRASAMNEGSTNFRVLVTDLAGNSTCSTAHATAGLRVAAYEYDNSVAAPTIGAPTNGATLTTNPVTVSGTGEVGATVNVTVDGEDASCTTTVAGHGTWSCNLDESLYDGTYTLNVNQTDIAGNDSINSGISFMMDTPDPMVLVFDTNLEGGANQVTLPLRGTVNVTVDWGDGSSDNYTTTGDKTHNYASEGTYTVTIRGALTQFGSGGFSYTNSPKLTQVISFGELGLTSLSGAFRSANLTSVPNSLPTSVTDLSYLFIGANSFNQNISTWNTSNITNMSGMFIAATSFNQNISTWNTSNVTNMESMFRNATIFNQNIGSWNTANVTNMYRMFWSATSFNQDISSWNTSNVTNMSYMFYGATAFNQNIGTWNTGNVNDMSFMFRDATSFNQNIGAWNTSLVNTMQRMFEGATNFNGNIGAWNTASVTIMEGMFRTGRNFNQNISAWNTSNVTNMGEMFNGATDFNQDIGAWNTSNVTSMSYMFADAINFNRSLALWDTSDVTTMSGMFYRASSANPDMRKWNFSSVTNFTNMFFGVTLPTSTYSNFLNRVNATNAQTSRSLNAGSSKYSSLAQSSRNNLTGAKSWTISDGGLDVDPSALILVAADVDDSNKGSYNVTGVCTEDATDVDITIADTDGGTTNVTETVACSSGTFSFTNLNVSELVNSTLTVSIAHSTATDSTQVTKNAAAVLPLLTITSPTDSERINDDTPTISGSGADAGNTVTVTVDSNASTCDAIADGDGDWSCTLAPALTGGASVSYTINAIQTDGVLLSIPVSIDVVLDDEAPAVPSIVLNDPASSPGNDATPEFEIELTGGVNFIATDVITLHEGADCSGGVVGTTITQTGTSALITRSSGMAEGTTSFRVLVTDLAGNATCSTSHATGGLQVASYQYDGTDPDPPINFTPADGTITNDTTPTIAGAAGSAEAGAAISVDVAGDTTGSCTTTAAGDGSWTCNVSALTGGALQALTIEITQTDIAGNISDPTTFNMSLDTTTPDPPSISSPVDSSTTANGNITVSGTAEFNADVTVTVDGESATCNATANGAGSWSCTLDATLVAGTYTLEAIQTDVAGNGPSTADTSTVTVSESGWYHEAYLKAPNNSAEDLFGSAVAISGDTAIVGAVAEESNTTSIINGSDLSATNNSGVANGAVYVYKRSGDTWSHEAYLKAPNTTNGDWFGWSVGLSGNTAAVGALWEDSNTTSIINGSDLSTSNNSGSDNGAVYVFKRSGSTWVHEAYLKSPNNSNGDNFSSLSVSGDTIVVGAPAEDSTTTSIIQGNDLSTTNNSGIENGAVYVFKRSGSTWSHEAYLKAPNNTDNDWFGRSVSISGDTLAVGSHNEDSNTTSIINGSDLSATNDSGSGNGAVYVFKRTGSTWAQEAYLKAPNTSNNDYLGYSGLSISGDTIAVGAQNEASDTTAIINGSDLSSTNNSGSLNGAVYVFRRSGSTWGHEAYLKAPNHSNGDQFGYTVSVSEERLVVGSWQEDSNTTTVINGSDLSTTNNSGSNNGAAYVFKRSGSTWSHDAYLKAPNTTNGDQFGFYVSISGGTIIVGAPNETSSTTAILNGSDLSSSDNAGVDNGAAYIFRHGSTPEAPGITLDIPATSPNNDATPSFTITRANGGNFVATDKLTLYGALDCGGTALDINEATSGTTEYSGSTSQSQILSITDDQAEGTSYYSVKLEDADGNTVCSNSNGTPSEQYVAYTLDTSDPAAPTISAPLDGSYTNNTQFTVSGSGLETGSTMFVAVTGGGGQSCSTSTNLGGGTWSCTLSGTLTGGAAVALTVSAEQEDQAGNTSTADTINITLDTSTPSAPVISSPADNDTLSSGDITVSGTSEANADINVTVDGETANCTDTADGSGNWSCQLDETLADGTYVIESVQTDVAGNGPSVADTVTVTVSESTTWAHQAYLKAPNNTSGDNFGYSVSVSGNTAVVGAVSETSTTTSIINGSDLSSTDDSGNGNGAAYVFKRTGSTWAHEAYLKAPNNSENDSFGSAVTISSDTIVVGTASEDSTSTNIINGFDLSSTNNSGTNNGAVYVFKRTGSTWAHEAYLKSPNNSDGDFFGYSVSVSGDTIAVGASNEDSTTTAIINGSNLAAANDSGSNNGAVYVFKRSGSTWTHEAYLKAPNNTNSDYFGLNVSISGETIVVGAPYETSTTTSIINGTDLSSTNDSGSNNGAVYVFKRTGSNWAHEAYLKAPNNSNGDFFGYSVSISGDTIAAGSIGEASNTTAIISGSDLSSTNNSGSLNGAVYVFKRSGTSWTHEAYLKSANNSDMDQFGRFISLSLNTIAVGAYSEDSTTTAIINGSDLSSTNNSGANNGAAYVFKRTGSTWGLETYLKAPNGLDGDQFGSAVSVDADTVVVGAPAEKSTTSSIINGSDLSSTDDAGSSNGAVYIFVRD